MKIKEVLGPMIGILLLVIIGSVLFGIFYFFSAWEWLKGYFEIVFMFASRWRDVVLAMLGWGIILVCLSRVHLLMSFPWQFLTGVLVVYIIWGREGIDVLYSLEERIPLAMIMLGIVLARNIVVGGIKLIFQELF